MFEKVNPMHPDKIADRIAGAIVDLAYTKEKDPRIAVEVLIGHGMATVIAESSVTISREEVMRITGRICPDPVEVRFSCVKQDQHLAKNQEEKIRCGDNGIFKGTPVTAEQQKLSHIAREIYADYPTDGKYILDENKLIICQSSAAIEELSVRYPAAVINPLGPWSGGINADCGATNRKLGSDMADSVTGGGLHGKDLSKADVSINIYVWRKAQMENRTVQLSCAIGDEMVDGRPYEEIVEFARQFIKNCGGFEKFAEWGLV